MQMLPLAEKRVDPSHHQMYVDLAGDIAGMPAALARLEVLADHEASVLSQGEQPVRLHS